MGALCRRIALAAIHERDYSNTIQYKELLAKCRVEPESICEWLAGKKCLLLIDEINNIKGFKEKQSGRDPESPESVFADFLRDNFLRTPGRYFVFTSHLVSTSLALKVYLDNNSERKVELRQLPLIPSVRAAATSFNWFDLNARQALYFGLVPALIYTFHKKKAPSAKRKSASDEWQEQKPVYK